MYPLECVEIPQADNSVTGAAREQLRAQRQEVWNMFQKYTLPSLRDGTTRTSYNVNGLTPEALYPVFTAPGDSSMIVAYDRSDNREEFGQIAAVLLVDLKKPQDLEVVFCCTFFNQARKDAFMNLASYAMSRDWYPQRNLTTRARDPADCGRCASYMTEDMFDFIVTSFKQAELCYHDYKAQSMIFPKETLITPFSELVDLQKKAFLDCWEFSVQKVKSGEMKTSADINNVELANEMIDGCFKYAKSQNDPYYKRISTANGENYEGLLMSEDGKPVAYRIYRWVPPGQFVVDLDFTLWEGSGRGAFDKIWKYCYDRWASDKGYAPVVKTNAFTTEGLADFIRASQNKVVSSR